jgi:hypothetical protein
LLLFSQHREIVLCFDALKTKACTILLATCVPSQPPIGNEAIIAANFPAMCASLFVLIIAQQAKQETKKKKNQTKSVTANATRATSPMGKQDRKQSMKDKLLAAAKKPQVKPAMKEVHLAEAKKKSKEEKRKDRSNAFKESSLLDLVLEVQQQQHSGHAPRHCCYFPLIVFIWF